MSLSAGTRLGPFEIVAPIGAGGMGEVYRARDAKLNREVAIKILPESLADDRERLARFSREAQVLAALNHPNIAHIHGFEDTTGVPALVMELVEGPPAMTQMGVILGTAAYMSPEQAKGRPADKRSDVWSFGCVLYEMLSGKRAFDGEDVSETLAAIIRAEPDWNALPADVTPAVRTLIRRCIAKDRRQRIGDIAVAKFVMAEPQLLSVVGAPPVAVAAASVGAWRRVTPIVATALATTGLLAGGVWIFRVPVPQPVVARSIFPLPEGQILTTTVRSMIGISPDGTRLAYIANSRIFVRSLSEFESHPIPGTEAGPGLAISYPVFSSDAQSIVYASQADRGLKRIAIAGGAGVKLCGTENPPFGISWDSTGIVFGQGARGIYRCPADGGVAEQIVSVNNDEEAHGPQMLPGGGALIFTLARTADGPLRWDKAQIVVQTLASGARKTLIEGGSDARYAPTGHLLYLLGGVAYAVRFDAARQQILGVAVPIVEGVRRATASTTGAAQLTVSSTGTLAYVPGPISSATTQREVAIVDRSGNVSRVSLPPATYTLVRTSRDGTLAAIGSDDGRQAIVWIYELAGANAPRRLTLEGQNRFPVWSPDGTRIAFQSDREKDLAIFAHRADGTGTTERLTKPEEGATHVPQSWSPDSRHLLFSSDKGSRSSLWALSLADKKVARFGSVESAEAIGAMFSPDGRWVAYSVGTGAGAITQDRGIYIEPFPATGERYQAPRRGLDFHPVWAPKGTELFYVPSAASGQLAVVSVRTNSGVSFGSPVVLDARVTADRRSNETRAWDILPDGRFIGLALPSQPGATERADAPQIRIVTNWFEELKQRVPAK